MIIYLYIARGKINTVSENKTNRDVSVDLIRVLCAAGITVFHFGCHVSPECRPILVTYANGRWGAVFVNIFFMISGGMLYLNNPYIKNVTAFYKKRALSIYPLYHMTFIFFYILQVIRSRDPFYGGNPVKLILSFTGMDGYFLYLGNNYYQTGEWFLGAIIMMYLIYPWLTRLMNINDLYALIPVIIGYATVYIPGLYRINQGANLFTCLLCFTTGILLFKHSEYWKQRKTAVLISLLTCIILITVKTGIRGSITDVVLAVTLFIVMYAAGEMLKSSQAISRIVSSLAGLTYPLFLVHHAVILKALSVFTPHEPLSSYTYLVIVTIGAFIAARVLNTIFYYVRSLIQQKTSFKQGQPF